MLEKKVSVMPVERGFEEREHLTVHTDNQNREGSLDRILTSIEKREILSALNRTQGQRTQAARLLGISRSRLYRRMEALDIDPRKFSSQPSSPE